MLLGSLWIAGGASRADAPGQAVVRSAAWLLVIPGILFVRSQVDGLRPILFILLAAILLPLLQLVPLPPMIWQALPGREVFAEAAVASGQAQPWRAWSIVPGATMNALSSLIVPAATLYFLSGFGAPERGWLPGVILALIAASTMLGALQFSGAGFNNPLINDTLGQVSGIFANRNHFALFLAIGCLLAPVWAFYGDRPPRWRAGAAVGLMLLFTLTILATGSRAGLVLGFIGVAIGLGLARRGIRRALRRIPPWLKKVAIVTVVAMFATALLISVAADRAVSIERALAIDLGQDMRSRGLPTVIFMVKSYFPAGGGFGAFDPLFRIHEPFDLLKPTYFNHAHNDWLEIVLEGGAVGLILLIATVSWWGWASLHAWRGGSAQLLPRMGSAILLLVFIASIFDYPARTPMMMAIIVIAGFWLCGDPREGAVPALRAKG